MFMETVEDVQKAKCVQDNFEQHSKGTRTVELGQVFDTKLEHSFEINSAGTFGADGIENSNCKGHSEEEDTELQSEYIGSAEGLCGKGAAAVSLMVGGSWEVYAAKQDIPSHSPEDINSPSSPSPPPPQLHVTPESARAAAATAVEISCSLEYGALPLNAIAKLEQPI